MAWNSGNLLRRAIHVDGVVAAFAQKLAAMPFKMSNEIESFHELG